MDRVEGLGYGYDEKEISVYDAQGNVERAVTYCATKFDESLLPYSWYKEHVLVGAVEANLSVEYIAQIKAIEAKTDLDRERSAEQRAIHT